MSRFSLRNWAKIVNHHYDHRPIYWSVLNHVTNQSHQFDWKSDAVDFRNTLPHATVYFHWYEREFTKINLTLEPEQSLGELCRQRAQEIRDTYRYVRLWYSGGCDSHTALMSFVDNNIHLDEIVVIEYADSNVANQMESTNREIALVAMPALREIAPRIPKTKITVVKAGERDISEWFGKPIDETNIPSYDSVDGGYGFYLGFNWGMSKLFHQTDMLDWCDLFGGSKVRLYTKDGRWYFYFVDTSVNDSFSSTRTEDFFVSRTSPDLYLKTVYTLKNYHIARGSTDQEVNTLHSDIKKGIEYNLALGRIPVDPLAMIKYYIAQHNPDEWRQLMVSGFHGRTFFKNVINTDQGRLWYKNYQENCRILIDKHQNFWNQDSRGQAVPYLGVKGNLSRFYCLNDNRSYDSSEIGYTG